MRKTTEVLRLAAQGLSQRQIAAGAGLDKTTVAEYLARAANRGRPVPDWRAVHRQLKDRRHHVTLRLLWVEWKADHPGHADVA